RHRESALAIMAANNLYPASPIEPQSETADALRARADFEGAEDPFRGIQQYEEILAKLQASDAKPESRLGDAQEIASIYNAISALYRRTGNTDAAQRS